MEKMISVSVENNTMSQFKLSRIGQKLNISDDPRILLALPRDIPERLWADVIQKEENELVCFDIREEILNGALSIGYERYMEKQTTLFTGYCVEKAWSKLISWQFYLHDPGDEPTAHPPCFIPKRAESWTADEIPECSRNDTWAWKTMTVLEETPPVLVKPSSRSLNMPEIDVIPKQYWFPGKVDLSCLKHKIVPTSSEEWRTRNIWTQSTTEFQKKYSRTSLPSIRDTILADSEVLQKVTDYGSNLVSAQESSMSANLKRTTPVDGSLHGAGDSTFKLRAKRSVRRPLEPAAVSRSSIGKKRSLPPIEADSSRVSAISDCRLRSIRVETQYEIASEKISTPPIKGGRFTKRK